MQKYYYLVLATVGCIDYPRCWREMLLEGKKVKIDGLGIFYTTIENTKYGADKEEAPLIKPLVFFSFVLTQKKESKEKVKG